MDYRPLLLDALETLFQKEQAEKQRFKALAYQQVLRQLKQHPGPISTYEDVAHFKGMGPKIEQKIRELLATGSLAAAERAKAAYPIQALHELQRCYGIGPTKARELTEQGITTIDALRAAVEVTPRLLTDAQRVGLTHYEAFLERIPYSEMVEHEDILRHYLPLPCEIVGSYRRRAESSGDIDVLIRVPPSNTISLAQMVKTLQEAHYLTDVLALGAHKCMAACQRDESSTPRRLDLLMVPEEEYAYGMLYFTGSDRFNVAFRQYALERGYTLNEKTMKPLADQPAPPPMNEEADIFTFLGLTYVPPNERMDARQILPLPKDANKRIHKRPVLSAAFAKINRQGEE